ncbi:aminoglycoside phosphotransferase family protein [Flexivirga alba]|uniref:Aminoglycoside phosphotransferase family protein n=1 Tax=Flexivirga alba TaxID=702742 RepID=A0ABW2AJK2_9MICO
MVWTGAAPGRDLMSLALDEPSAIRLTDAVGRALATLHTAPAGDDVPVARAPWPLLSEPLPSMTTHPPDRDRDAVLATWRESAVQAALRPLSVSWAHSDRWTHGDLSASNVITETDGAVTFIDLESAGRGDPCWDLVTLEQTFASIGLSPFGFRRAYAAAGGPASPCPLAWRTVRALVTAWQHAALPGGNHSIVEQQLDEARRCARDVAPSMQEESR